MWPIIKKIISSKFFLGLVSIVLIYFAFKKVDVKVIILELSKVPVWFVIFNLIYQFFLLLLIAYRWTILVFEKPKLIDAWNFVRAIYISMFYSLFFPSSGTAIDMVKWVPLVKKYPDLSKSKLLGTLVLDRVLTLTAFYFMAFISLIGAKMAGFVFPGYLFLIISIIFLIFLVVFVLLLSGKLDILFNKVPYLNKLKNVDLLLKDRKKIIKSVSVGLVSEILWLLPIWIISNMFGAGFSLLSIYVFVPLITTILILPISFSGFGAREQLFLFFFGQLHLNNEKILLVSTFFGVIGIVSCLLGGLFMFASGERNQK